VKQSYNSFDIIQVRLCVLVLVPSTSSLASHLVSRHATLCYPSPSLIVGSRYTSITATSIASITKFHSRLQGPVSWSCCQLGYLFHLQDACTPQSSSSTVTQLTRGYYLQRLLTARYFRISISAKKSNTSAAEQLRIVVKSNIHIPICK
jgi:hypothetical protein